jgi:sugar phosphate isomerase/epimerase
MRKKDPMHRIGLSPAFVISSATAGFSAWDYLPAIRRASAMEFQSLQLEVFRTEAIEEWTFELQSEVRQSLAGAGLIPSQFVAHFMLEDFRSAASLAKQNGLATFDRFLELAAAFQDCPVVTLPIPPFAAEYGVGPEAFAQVRSSLVDHLGNLLERATAAGKRLALEVMPHSVIGGTEGFLRLSREAGLASLAYNFDTGHAWARKESLELIPALLGEALVGTHLCDNHGHESLKLRPGRGTIDFAAVLASLEAAGYRGFLDLEILCPPDAVEREYASGMALLEALISQGQGALEERNHG